MGAYDVDFHRWLLEQADAIRRRSMNEIDWDNLAEEVESLGKSQRRSLDSRLTKLLSHLLKWEVQPERRSRSWRDTVMEQRRRIPMLLRDSPSLRPALQELFDEVYPSARYEASQETNLRIETFPAAPPFSLEQALNIAWPEGLAWWEPQDDA